MSKISPEFPFKPRYQEVLGSKMHYVEAGKGDPILLLHGNPTSSYLWRNIIPGLTSRGRVIAVDLIGMGKSDKPDIYYRFVDHSRYLDAFIDSMGLKNITLVIHDWGSALGFYYAHRHQDNVKGLAFMEGVFKTAELKKTPKQIRVIFSLFRNPIAGRALIQGLNFFVNKMIPMSVSRKMTEAEMQHYRAPFPTFTSRKPLFRWPNEIPFDKHPRDVHDIVSSYRAWLEQTDKPKLLLWAKPGAIVSKADVADMEAKFPNLKSVFIGTGLHFIQEDEPFRIADEISLWMQEQQL